PVAAVHVFPTAVGNSAWILRIADPGTVVLKAAVNVIGPVVVEAHVIELRDRQVVAFPPSIGAVIRVPESAIVAGHYVVGVVWINPDVVKVTMRATGDVAEALAAVATGD